MSILQKFFIYFILMPVIACAADNDKLIKGTSISSITHLDKKFSDSKNTPPYQQPESNEKDVQALFENYMLKAAGHFHLGEREKQLGCYKEILNIEGLSKPMVARTYTNMAVVHLHLGHNLAAAALLSKAETLASMQELEQIIGIKVYNVFASAYSEAAVDLYYLQPKQALEFLKKVLEIPKLNEKMYSSVHLKLAVLYDSLLMSSESLTHALQALNDKTLTTEEHDKALCFASVGSRDTGNFDDCISYFKQIVNLGKLHNNECFLVLSAVAGSYWNKEEGDTAINLLTQAIKVLDSSSPQYLIAKHELAGLYGVRDNKEKEIELYGEMLEIIKSNTFEEEWLEPIQSIQMLIETFFFTDALGNTEQLTSEKLNKQKTSEERKQKRENRKKKAQQQFIEQIKMTQREAVEKEKKLNEEKNKKIEAEKTKAKERKKHYISIQEPHLAEPSSSQTERYIPEQKPSKTKTRGVSTKTIVLEEEAQSSVPPPLLPALPKLGTCAQTVFNQIEDEDWDFTREDYSHYLEDLQCNRRETGSSHRVFQLPKATIITLERNGQKIIEHVLLANLEDIKLGSVTLPAWKGKEIPFYLRRQLRSFHDKIVTLYTKVTSISDAKLPNRHQ